MKMLFAIVLFAAASCVAQSYPSKVIRVITGSPTGGSGVATRILTPALSSALGQPITIDNRGGGSTSIEIAAKAAPDGYTVLITGSSYWTEPFIYKTTFNPVADFASVAWIGITPNVLVVHPSMPVKSVKDLIALAKAKPGQVDYAIGLVGGVNHLMGELLNTMAGIKLNAVPYSALSQLMADVVAGRVPITFNTAAVVMPMVKSGRLRAIAVTSKNESALVPGVPAISKTLPGYEASQNIVMVVPARTPEAVIHRLNQETVRILPRSDLIAAGIDVVGSSPGDLDAAMRAEIDRMSKLIKSEAIVIKRTL